MLVQDDIYGSRARTGDIRSVFVIAVDISLCKYIHWKKTWYAIDMPYWFQRWKNLCSFFSGFPSFQIAIDTSYGPRLWLFTSSGWSLVSSHDPSARKPSREAEDSIIAEVLNIMGCFANLPNTKRIISRLPLQPESTRVILDGVLMYRLSCFNINKVQT